MRENWADLIEKALKTIFPQSDRVAICHAYGAEQGSRGLLDGLEDLKAVRARGDLMRPVLVYGFDPEERVREHESGSILDAPGVFYVRLPARLSDIEAIIQKAARAEIPENQAIDEKSFRDYAVKQTRAFKHRLDNVCASMEMNANRARKELERSPGVMPRALSEFKASIIRNLLTEYGELDGLVKRLSIPDGDRAPGMMKQLLVKVQEIEGGETAPAEGINSAFFCVEAGQAVSTILGRAKES